MNSRMIENNSECFDFDQIRATNKQTNKQMNESAEYYTWYVPDGHGSGSPKPTRQKCPTGHV